MTLGWADGHVEEGRSGWLYVQPLVKAESSITLSHIGPRVETKLSVQISILL